MKITILVFTMVLTSLVILLTNSRVNYDVNKKIACQSSIDLIWKTIDSLKEHKHIFTMYFFYNNDTVTLISDNVMLKKNINLKKIQY